MENKRIKFGLTQTFPCNYLTDQEEQLLVLLDNQLINAASYDELMNIGFRRSGENIYRPHCPNCSACNSVRIPVEEFTPSKSQKRIWNKNKQLIYSVSNQAKESYYQLYEEYINTVHQEGTMFPASRPQYDGFLFAQWLDVLFIEIYDQDKLVAVAVTDYLNSSLSALYTFYSPDYLDKSLGTFAIMQQIAIARQMGKKYLYLGYQIDQCNKMNYKSRFFPHHRLIKGNWEVMKKKR